MEFIYISATYTKRGQSAYHSQLHSSTVLGQHPSVDTLAHNLVEPHIELMLDL